MKTKILTIITPIFIFCFCFHQADAQDYYEEGYVEKMSFEEKLLHIRSIMIEGDEMATMARSQNKIDKALEGFLQTEFMEKYKEIKLEAEILAATFKAHSQVMAPSEVSRVKKAYTLIADQFNTLLLDIKNDFLDRKKLKAIRSQPEMYSNSLQYRLGELKDDYSQNFERIVAETTGSDMYSAVPLAAIFGMIKLAVDFTNYISTAKFQMRKVKEEHLLAYFIEPYKFKDWIDIEISEGDIYDQAMQEEEYTDEETYEMNPFVEEKKGTQKKKKHNN